MDNTQKFLNRKRETFLDKFPQDSDDSDFSNPKIEKNFEKEKDNNSYSNSIKKENINENIYIKKDKIEKTGVFNYNNNINENNTNIKPEKIEKNEIFNDKNNIKNNYNEIPKMKKDKTEKNEVLNDKYEKKTHYNMNTKIKDNTDNISIIDITNDRNRNKVIKLDNNIIQFIGNHKDIPLNEKKHFVFVDNILHNIILNDPSNEVPDIIKWKIKLHNTSKWIAFGLCDKGKLLKHKYYWFNPKKLDWRHGTFLLTNQKYTFNSVNLEENTKIRYNNFPDMKEGAEIEMEYSPFDAELNFYYKDKCIKLTKVISNAPMREYDINGKIGQKELYILTPCVVFLNDQDKIELIYDD